MLERQGRLGRVQFVQMVGGDEAMELGESRRVDAKHGAPAVPIRLVRCLCCRRLVNQCTQQLLPDAGRIRTIEQRGGLGAVLIVCVCVCVCVYVSAADPSLSVRTQLLMKPALLIRTQLLTTHPVYQDPTPDETRPVYQDPTPDNPPCLSGHNS